MKIAILTSGILPVPAAQGGAVENLIDFYLEYNDKHLLHDMTVYSVDHSKVRKHPALKSEVNHYHFVKMDSWLAKLKRKWYARRHGEDENYHYTIEFFLNECLKHIRKQAYDIIILENRPAYALKLKQVTNAKLIYHIHNRKLEPNTKNALEIYESATRIITVSDFITGCIRIVNPNDTRCLTVHNGIDINAFRASNYNSQQCRSDLQLRKEDFVLVYSGRINQEKGIKELIMAMKQLDSYTDIKLLVLGSSFYGNDNTDDPFIKSLKEDACTLKGKIIFTGFIPYSQMPMYLNAADLAIIPSVWDDPFPTTVLEAQAMGLPIISTRRGGIPEEVMEKNAILLDTDEHFVDNLANAILDLYNHPEKRKEMAKASLERSKMFDKETYAKNFFAALES